MKMTHVVLMPVESLAISLVYAITYTATCMVDGMQICTVKPQGKLKNVIHIYTSCRLCLSAFAFTYTKHCGRNCPPNVSNTSQPTKHLYRLVISNFSKPERPM